MPSVYNLFTYTVCFRLPLNHFQNFNQFGTNYSGKCFERVKQFFKWSIMLVLKREKMKIAWAVSYLSSLTLSCINKTLWKVRAYSSWILILITNSPPLSSSNCVTYGIYHCCLISLMTVDPRSNKSEMLFISYFLKIRLPVFIKSRLKNNLHLEMIYQKTYTCKCRSVIIIIRFLSFLQLFGIVRVVRQIDAVKGGL